MNQIERQKRWRSDRGLRAARAINRLGDKVVDVLRESQATEADRIEAITAVLTVVTFLQEEIDLLETAHPHDRVWAFAAK